MQTLQRHPGKHVFGVVDQSKEVERILKEVDRRGVAKSDVQVVGDEPSGDQEAPAQDHHGALEGVTHAVAMVSEEHEFNELYQSEVEAGRRLVGIPVSRTIDKDAAQDILHRHGAHFINYFGPWVVEELES
ncbi:MAG: hypothetical protein GEU71_00815 [Actinobacteria bacterium]|nr:hypothetical protein [Actinomycetota bacterium]